MWKFASCCCLLCHQWHFVLLFPKFLFLLFFILNLISPQMQKFVFQNYCKLSCMLTFSVVGLHSLCLSSHPPCSCLKTRIILFIKVCTNSSAVQSADIPGGIIFLYPLLLSCHKCCGLLLVIFWSKYSVKIVFQTVYMAFSPTLWLSLLYNLFLFFSEQLNRFAGFGIGLAR